LTPLNPGSLKTVRAVVEPTLANAQPEERFQFEPHGFLVVNLREHQAAKEVVLNRVTGLRDLCGR